MAAGPPIPRPVDSLPGAPAPWSRLAEERRRAITIDEVRLALAAVPRGVDGNAAVRAWQRVTPAELPSGTDARPAAVLCLLFEHDGEANVVLTRRAAHLRSHSGEVSFPGGRLQPGELPLQAALREANEEIGVDAGSVEVIGELTPLTTVRSPVLVRCFVGRWQVPRPEDMAFASDPAEVEKVFSVPLADLARQGVYHEELWPSLEDRAQTTYRPDTTYRPHTTYRAVAFFHLDDDIVWGATGRLLTELVGTVLARRTG
jgi:peroxisomal coenzyme A diphosphatase NUDT7